MVGTQIRTIFLAVRGVSMLGESLSKPRSEMSELEKKQADLARSSYRLLFAGAAFLTFGIFMMRALGGLLTQSSKGAVMLDDLGLAWGRFSSRLSASVARTLEWQVKSIIGLLEAFSENQSGMEGLGTFLTYGAELVTLLGAIAISAAGLRVVGGVAGGILGFLLNLSPSITFGLALKGAAILTGIQGALMGALSAIGVVVGGSVAIPITIAIIAAIAAWQFLVPEDTKRQIMESIGDWWRGVTGAPSPGTTGGGGTRGTGPSHGIYGTEGVQQNDVTVNIYGNTWDRNVDESTLGQKVGQEIADSFAGTVPLR